MRIASVWNVKRKKQGIKVTKKPEIKNTKKPEIKKLKKLEKEITTLKE